MAPLAGPLPCSPLPLAHPGTDAAADTAARCSTPADVVLLSAAAGESAPRRTEAETRPGSGGRCCPWAPGSSL